MASPWRRRSLCVLVAGRPVEVALCDVSARGARVATELPLPLGAAVELHHPEAGMMSAYVVACEAGALRLAFASGPQAIGFALAATASDMTRAR